MRTRRALERRRYWTPGDQLLGVAVLLSLCSCFARPLWVADWSGPLDRLDGQYLSSLAAVDALAERGEGAAALALLEDVAGAVPNNLPVAIALQDARLAALESAAGTEAPGTGLPVEQVGDRMKKGLVALLLAARGESDGERARELLKSAASMAPAESMAWVHYARAHGILAAGGDWEAAREELRGGLILVPGHVPSRRLEAWMAARRGSPGRGAELLRAWIEAVGDDARVPSAQRRRARLDLARCLILEGEAKEALAALAVEDAAALTPSGDWGAETGARYLLKAAAHQASGAPEQALAAARAAVAEDPRAFLPHIQEALLCESSAAEAPAAAAAWERVVELSKEVDGLGHLLEAVRARVHLERAEQAAGQAEAAEAAKAAKAAEAEGAEGAADAEGESPAGEAHDAVEADGADGFDGVGGAGGAGGAGSVGGVGGAGGVGWTGGDGW